MVLGAAVKLTAGLLLPFALAARHSAQNETRRRFDLLVGRRGRGGRRRPGSRSRCSAPARCTCPSTLQTIQNEGDWHSIPGFISTRLGLGGGRARHRARARGSCSCVVLLRAAPPRRDADELDWIDGAGWATLAML